MNFKKTVKENKFWIIAAIFATIVLCIFLLSNNIKNKATKIPEQIIHKKTFDYQSVLNSIEAKSFYVYDLAEDKPIFAKNEHARLPLASITKLMSGLVVLDVLPDTTTITITPEDISLEGDSGLYVGEKWKLRDLLNFSLIESSNDGMHAIASTLDKFEAVNNTNTISMMNKKAASLNMKDTIFINETGLDLDKTTSGAYSSAYDISILLKNIIINNPSLISDTNKTAESFISESNIKHIAINTDTSINKIPSLIASKTGFTDLAGGNLAIVFDAGIMHPIAIVVLGSTADGRFSDAMKLIKVTLEKLSE